MEEDSRIRLRVVPGLRYWPSRVAIHEGACDLPGGGDGRSLTDVHLQANTPRSPVERALYGVRHALGRAFGWDVSWLTSPYLVLIEPFRRFLLYPAMLRRIRNAWQAVYGEGSN